jgi:SPP1 gp7 family putative phage head morphogenesis protein
MTYKLDKFWPQEIYEDKEFNPAYHKAFIDYLRFGKSITVPYYRQVKSYPTRGYYIWHTQEDSRVRPSHAANNRKVFSWSSPPVTGHPGQERFCRCWAEPCAPPQDIEDVDIFIGIFDPSQEGSHSDMKRHPSYGKLYQDIDNPKIWYSKERSGKRAHGGEHWKKFKKMAKNLIIKKISI